MLHIYFTQLLFANLLYILGGIIEKLVGIVFIKKNKFNFLKITRFLVITNSNFCNFFSITTTDYEGIDLKIL